MVVCVWVVRLFHELDMVVTPLVPLYDDSKAAIQIAANPVFHECTKHIDIDCHFIREKVLTSLVTIQYLPTEEHAADVLTKDLGRYSMSTLYPN